MASIKEEELGDVADENSQSGDQPNSDLTDADFHPAGEEFKVLLAMVRCEASSQTS